MQCRAFACHPIDDSHSSIALYTNGKPLEREYQFKFGDTTVHQCILYKENNAYGLPIMFNHMSGFPDTAFTVTTDEQAKNHFNGGPRGNRICYATIFEFDIVMKDNKGNCYKLGSKRVKLLPQHIDIIDETGATP
mgnify:CR=1 FL=1